VTIEAIERAAAIAWPALETTTLGAWVLRAGAGFSRRRNSAVPEGPLPPELDHRIHGVSEWYRERGLPMLFRITPTCAPAIDTELADRGLAFEAPTLVMSRPIDESEPVEGVVAAAAATEAWIRVELEALGVHGPLVSPWLATLRSVPSPAAFVAPTDGDRLVGAGLGVVVNGLLGVFEIAVHPKERRRGYATRMMAALHRFGVQEGADRAFLQVLEEDERAITLYRSLGYEISHRYWYRRADT
jgi:ribosomal protein S18 acetylase RimI-like enzyme